MVLAGESKLHKPGQTTSWERKGYGTDKIGKFDGYTKIFPYPGRKKKMEKNNREINKTIGKKPGRNGMKRQYRVGSLIETQIVKTKRKGTEEHLRGRGGWGA